MIVLEIKEQEEKNVAVKRNSLWKTCEKVN